MAPRIVIMAGKNFAGIRVKTTLAKDNPKELWQGFMPRRNEFTNRVGNELYSIQVFDPEYFGRFNPQTEFEKWAAVEVADFNSIPEGMDTISAAGVYAVFLHKGPASKGPETLNYIFTDWLPASGFDLDLRPHFGLMGAKYKHEEADSEEELWIPIKDK